jgi:metal transporter CNNM
MGIVVEYTNSSEKDPMARAVGIVTLEDIIEEMIQEEIIDETDIFSKSNEFVRDRRSNDIRIFLADNRGKVRNMLSQAPDFSAFIHQTETYNDTTRISAQMKVAILQFLSTSRLVDVCSVTTECVSFSLFFSDKSFL